MECLCTTAMLNRKILILTFSPLPRHSSVHLLIDFLPTVSPLSASLHHRHPPPLTSLPGRSLRFVVSCCSHFQPESLPPLPPPSWLEPPLRPALPPLSAAAPQLSSPALHDSSCGHSDSSLCKTPWGTEYMHPYTRIVQKDSGTVQGSFLPPTPLS